MRADILRVFVVAAVLISLGGMSLSIRNAYGQSSSEGGGCLSNPNRKAPEEQAPASGKSFDGKGGGEVAPGIPDYASESSTAAAHPAQREPDRPPTQTKK